MANRILAIVFAAALLLCGDSFAQNQNTGAHSGVGRCPSGKVVNVLNPNAPPGCVTAGGGGGGTSPGGNNGDVQYNNSGTFAGTDNFTTDALGDVTELGLLTVHNLQATTGNPDIKVQLDPNNDSLIQLQTGGANVGWGLQATDSSTLGHGHFAEFELVSALWEPFFCWGDGAGTFYNGTCGFQQPSTKEPLHLIRSTDVSPGGDMIDVETNGAGAELWSVDALGAEHFFGSSSGNITLQPQAASGTFNWNWPTTAGTSGFALLSGGGGSSPMTWGTVVSAISGGSCSAGSIVTSISSTGAVTCTQKTDKFSCPLTAAATNNAVLCDIPMTEAETVPTNCSASTGTSVIAAAGSTTYTIKKITSGGSSTTIGTAVWSASGKTAAFTCASPVSLAAGDLLEIDGPSTGDTTLTQGGLTISANAGAL